MQNEEKIWFRKSAGSFQEALPIGNGFLGAMIYGGAPIDMLSLNEDSLYAGKPAHRVNPDAKRVLPVVRDLLKRGELDGAQRIAQEGMLACPRYMHAYQPLTNFYIRSEIGGKISEYERGLDLHEGVVYTKYTCENAHFTRKYFASEPRKAIVVLLEADVPGTLSFSINMMRRPFDPGTSVLDGDTLVMSGNAGDGGMEYCCAAKLLAGDGKVEAMGDTIRLIRGTQAIIIITAATTYRHTFPLVACKSTLEIIFKNLSKNDFDNMMRDLIKEHTQDYGKFFNRVSLSLDTEDMAEIPTNERLARFKENQCDTGLYSLYFNYGRYLIICASRERSQAMNLQGIWNESFTPPWESAYTININLQMLYWPVQTLNLPELAEPLHQKIRQMHQHGRIVAREMYGCDGFVAHHNTSFWGDCAPSGAGIYLWPFGAAWLCLHLHEHYLHTLDEEFLENTAYPLIKDSVLFFLEFMSEDDEGYLVTGLTQSPENSYRLQNGQEGSLADTCTMDDAILRALFQAYLDEEAVLSLDGEFISRVQAALGKLRPYRIGSKSQLLEWKQEYEECEPGHRHMSHLFGLYPGRDIKPGTPLADACEKTLSLRLEQGSGHTGWSRAWMISFYARLYNSEKAVKHLEALISFSTYPNLMDAHPPFQMDGNSGGVAGLLEMLMQSDKGEIHLLPAIDEGFPDGRITGLRTRGGDLIDMAWEKGRVTRFSITPMVSGTRKLYYRGSNEKEVMLLLDCIKGEKILG